MLFDLFDANFTLGLDFSGSHRLFALDFCFLNLAFSKNARLLSFAMTFGFEGGNFGVLLGRAGLHLLLLLERHEGFLLFDFQLACQRITVFLTNGNFYVLLDFVTFATTAFCFLSQLSQTLGIKGVIRVEMNFFGLVKVGE